MNTMSYTLTMVRYIIGTSLTPLSLYDVIALSLNNTLNRLQITCYSLIQNDYSIAEIIEISKRHFYIFCESVTSIDANFAITPLPVRITVQSNLVTIRIQPAPAKPFSASEIHCVMKLQFAVIVFHKMLALQSCHSRQYVLHLSFSTIPLSYSVRNSICWNIRHSNIRWIASNMHEIQLHL